MRCPRFRIVVSLLLGAFLLSTTLLFVGWDHWKKTRGLPFRDSFALGESDEWTSLGGTWEISGNTMRNASDDRGSKLLTGSQEWEDYSVEADVMLFGNFGDAGLMIRSRNEEEGVDSYDGYYAGIRNHEQGLVLGRADYGWISESEDTTTSLGKIHSQIWYHLKVLTVGCYVAAEARLPQQGVEDATVIAVIDHSCLHSGRVGLRSYPSGGAWRNVQIRQAGQEDLNEMLSRTPSHKPHTQSKIPESSRSGDIVLVRHDESQIGPPNSNVTRISDLRLSSSSNNSVATVRGVVTLTSPSIFIQDSSGGLSFSGATKQPLNVGDEIEATGRVHPGDFSSTMDEPVVRVLWERTPQPPISVTALQAATGAYADRFVEIEAQLKTKTSRSDGSLVLGLVSNSEAFNAVIIQPRERARLEAVAPDSMLRLRGICVIAPQFTRSLTPFSLLVSSSSSVRVVAGPPWWNTTHTIIATIALVFIACCLNVVYGRAIRWRLKAVFDERERLAQEMHDTLAQSFAGVGFQLEAIRDGVPRDSTRIHQQLDFTTDLVRHSHEEARRSITALRPQALESGDLAFALALCAKRLVEGSQVEIHSSCLGEVRPIPLRVIDTFFRIGQEALANAVSHAAARRISVRLAYEVESIELLVSDDGRGFNTCEELRGFGIDGMRSRAARIGGVITVTSKPAAGTVVKVRAPLPRPLTALDWPRMMLNLIKGWKGYESDAR